MKKYKFTLPLIIGLLLSVILFKVLNWWGFFVIFPWIGFSISTGAFLRQTLKGQKKLLGRKVSLLMILPCLLFVVPVINNENFQLEGVFLIVLAGFFYKGFIHYAVAKLFGPLIWRRGFCGHACWTAAVLDWLPVKNNSHRVTGYYRHIRYVTLILSLLIPLFLVFVLSYNPGTDYINKHEMKWMFISNGLYYAVAIPLAFVLSDKRAFCKYVCPVSLVMIPASKIGWIKLKPDIDKDCIECRKCNINCPMGVNVMDYMKKNLAITDSECILCTDCKIVCPTNKIR